MDVQLWGTETVTLNAIQADGSNLVVISETANSKWIGQNLVFPQSTPYMIVRMNTANSFIIDPAYAGTAVASATQCTVEQVRIGLPANFGGIIDKVQRGGRSSEPVSPALITALERRTSWHGTPQSFYGNPTSTPYANVHAVVGKNLVCWPPAASRLFFRYKYRPSDMFEYRDGQAIVSPDPNAPDAKHVIGSGTKWTLVPNAGAGTVIEEDANVARGMPVSNGIVIAQDDTHLALAESWQGTAGTLFNYVLSTDLDMPPFMDKWVIAAAKRSAGKIDDQTVRQAYLDSATADSASEESMPSRSSFGYISVRSPE